MSQDAESRTPKPERRNQTRRAVTVQLIVGQDDDLIRMVESISQGSRQQRLKTVLRAGFSLPEPAPVHDPAEELRGELARVYSEIDTLRDMLNDKRGGAGIDVDRIGRIEKALGELTTWAQSAHDQIERLYAGAVTSAAQVIPEPEEQPGDLLSVEKAREREKRMKRNQW